MDVAPIDRRRLAWRLALQAVIGLSLIDLALFGGAGRADWPAAWLFTAIFVVYLTMGATYFVRRNPELLQERMSRGRNVPLWDRVLIRFYRVLTHALFLTAALDAGRFRWSQVPIAAQMLGLAGVFCAFAVIWWCTASNPFLSSHVRLQTDRGHTVVQDGPYRFVRHPMYTSLIVLMFGTALLLGSWLATVPSSARRARIACCQRALLAMRHTRPVSRPASYPDYGELM
jgi:protein-S-isoprenylcysteine O-methyltransferase Ste14